MDEISLRSYCGQVRHLIERGSYQEAVAHGRFIIEQYPRHATTYQLLGRAMLETGHLDCATDLFKRALSADPEAALAWAGLGEAYERRGELDGAVWCQERAFELSPSNEAMVERLAHLCGLRTGSKVEELSLTGGALGRLHLRSGLLSQAVKDLRALLDEHGGRVDLRVALAETLWHRRQRLQAVQVCQQVLDQLPYCLKANLLLGEIWTSGGRSEGEVYLRRAEAVDPENRVAQKLFGPESPLPTREVRIVPLAYEPPAEGERPAWLTEIERTSPAERGAALLDSAEALEARTQIAGLFPEVTVSEAEPAVPEPPPSRAEEPPEEDVQGAEAAVAEAPTVSEAPTSVEIPGWLRGLAPPEPGEPETRPPEEEVTPPAPSEEALEVLEALAADDAYTPAWAEGEETLAAEDALAWLEQLAAEEPMPQAEEPPEEVVEAEVEQPVEVASGIIAAQRARVEEEPSDYAAWLALARALWRAGEQEEAVEACRQVVEGGQLVDETIQELENWVDRDPSVSTLRALGDAYTRSERVEDALDAYRRALDMV